MAQQVITNQGLIKGSTSPMAQLYDNVAGSAIASWDVTGISQIYNHLRVVLMARGDTAAVSTFARMRFNNDSAANYASIYMAADQGAAIAGVEENSATSIEVGKVAAATATASHPGISTIEIPAYVGTTFFKNASWTNGFHSALTTLGHTAMSGDGVWVSTAAINRITVFPTAGNFIAGSRLTIYGLL